MEMRQEAKQGLKKMEAMGQMGNADEATVPDDLPFDETDIIAEDDDGNEVEMQKGGLTPSSTYNQYMGGAGIKQAVYVNPETGDEKSYWPEMWSLDYLKEKKRQAPIAFSFQYMNQVVRQNELSLAPELIVKAEISTEFDTLGVGVDLSAGTKEKNDYTVMVLGGRIGDRIHIIDYRRIRVMGNLEKLDAMKELLNDWSIIGIDENKNYYPTFSTCDIWSEAVQYQASLEADFKRVCLNNEGLYNLIWHPVKGFRADKLARFRGIMGMFEDRKIIFNRYRNFTNLFEELTNFGVSSHDDCVDALVWLVNGLARKGQLHLDY
jgi:phage terminase large subunit-like protein